MLIQQVHEPFLRRFISTILLLITPGTSKLKVEAVLRQLLLHFVIGGQYNSLLISKFQLLTDVQSCRLLGSLDSSKNESVFFQ